MKITSVTFSRGVTINTGNFNSLRFDMSATAEVEDGDDADATYEKVRNWVRAYIKAEVDNAKASS